MKILSVACLTILYVITHVLGEAEINSNNQQGPVARLMPVSGAPVDEVVVASSLYIKPKQKFNTRRTRSLTSSSNLTPINLKLSSENNKFQDISRQARPSSNSAGNLIGLDVLATKPKYNPTESSPDAYKTQAELRN